MSPHALAWEGGPNVYPMTNDQTITDLKDRIKLYNKCTNPLESLRSAIENITFRVECGVEP